MEPTVTTSSSPPAIALLKEGYPVFDRFSLGQVPQLLSNALLADKGIEPSALGYLARPPYGPSFLPRMLAQLVLRLPDPYEHRLDLANGIEQLLSLGVRPEFTYAGTPEQNAATDSSIAQSQDRRGDRARIGRGSARFFSLGGVRLPRLDQDIRGVAIAILGAGAAGILAARTLLNAGFQNIFVFDQSGEVGGLWRQGNVRGGVTNNPFPFEYESLGVEAAPRPGEDITQFLLDLATPPPYFSWRLFPPVVRAKVLAVEPGDLAHRVTYRDGSGAVHSLVFPIVVNALGIGKPLPPSRPGVMETDVPHLAGIRWQQVWTPEQAEKLRGKTLGLIGFAGNSVAEMLVQILALNRRGYDIRYKAITHYPAESVAKPYRTISWRGRNYQLYRSPAFALTSLAGDLERIDDAVVHAVASADPDREEVLSEVVFWNLQQAQGKGMPATMTIRHADGRERSFPVDQLFTLIGYGHPREELDALGLVVTDDYLGSIAADVDGEVQRAPGSLGRARLHAGYSVLGSLLKSPANLNAQVIPGILYRLPDWLATVIVRAAECVVRG